MMKTSLRLLAQASVLALISGTTAMAQETLVVAGYGGSIEKIIRDKLLPDFEKQHNVKVTYVAGNSTDTLAKLVARKDNPEVDVAMIDDGPMARALWLGLCAPITGVNFGDLHEVARFPDNKASGLGIIATGLMYNTKVFQQNGWAPPTSWNDLKDPKYKGKVVMPPLSNGYGLVAVVMLARMNGGGEKNIEPGFKVMKESVGPNILAYEPSPAKHAELFQTGQAIFGVWGTARVQPLADSGVPVEFVYPKEGAPAIMTGICPVAKKSPNKAAMAFVNMMLSPAAQSVLADEAGFAPVNRKAQVKRAGMMPIGELAKSLVSIDWATVNPIRDDWNKRWVREIER